MRIKHIILLIFFTASLMVFGQDPIIPGDVNGDISVDVLDIVTVVSFVMGETQPTELQEIASDVNHDGYLDVLDIVTLVGFIVNPAECPTPFFNCPDIPNQCCDDNHPDAYSACENCHILDYFYTTSPPHVEQFYPHTQCNSCHVATSWTEVIFFHTVLDTACNICHLTEMQLANENVTLHNTLPSACVNCHVTDNWNDIVFPHGVTGFDLEGAHTATNCTNCHTDSWLGIERLCEGCHLDNYQQTSDPDHSVQIYLPADCENCHTAVDWIPSIYQHDLPDQAPCSTCHSANYQLAGSSIPDHDGFSTDCTICHQPTTWAETVFNHEDTNFPLTGAHDTADCIGCHADGYADLPLNCDGCHMDTWTQTANPDHSAQVYAAEDCEVCHTTDAWEQSIFEHGLPNQADCNVCHTANFEIASGTVDGHDGFSTDCTVCHQATVWTDILFNHDDTDFPLTGAHDTADCIGCHADGYADLPTDCGYCHLDNYSQTTDPSHISQIYPLTECAVCHNTTEWQPDIYNHLPEPAYCNICHLSNLMDANVTIPGHFTLPNNCMLCHVTDAWNQTSGFDHSITSFILEDAHLQVGCLDCHQTGFAGTSTECSSCHQDLYDQTTAPVHSSQIYLQDDCEYCHSALDWTPSVFDHAMPVSTPCSTCHLTEWEGANANIPGHQDFGDLCGLCHESGSWSASVDHTLENTGFELDGLHLQLSCLQCHPDGFDSNGVIRSCESADCHLTDYENSVEPHHFTTGSGGYPVNMCAICHNTAFYDFTPAVFNHNLSAETCYTCHQYDFENTTSPDHITSGYSQSCDNCHITTDTWEGADPHQEPLASCTTCHNYNGDGDPLPVVDHTTASKLGTAIDDCTNCHTSTSNWSLINFGSNQHDGSQYQIYFNVYSGDHAGEWNNDCTSNCHVFGRFNSFSCYQSCHEHGQTDLLGEHCDGDCESCSGSNGYWNIGTVTYTNGSWTSPNTFNQCYSCHPDGSNSGPCGDD